MMMCRKHPRTRNNFLWTVAIAGMCTLAPSKAFVSPRRPSSLRRSDRLTLGFAKLQEDVQLPSVKQIATSSQYSPESFDPLQLANSTNKNGLEIPLKLQAVEQAANQEKNEQIGLWAARAILLLVAAIWGTNFAVSGC